MIKRKQFKRLSITLSATLLIAGSAYLLGWSSFLSVSSVSIQGSEANLIINNKLIQSGVQPQVGSKLARVDIRAIKQSLTELDWIEDADISRNWFSKQIKINVIERVAIARSTSTQNTLINANLVRISWGRAQEVGQKSTVLKALLKLPENQQIKQVDLSQPSSPIIS